MKKKKALVGVLGLLLIGSCVGMVTEDDEVVEEAVVEESEFKDDEKEHERTEVVIQEDEEPEEVEAPEKSEPVFNSKEEEIEALILSSISEHDAVNGVQVIEHDDGYEVIAEVFYESSATLNMTANKMERDISNLLLDLDESGEEIVEVLYTAMMMDGDEEAQAIGARFDKSSFSEIDESDHLVSVQDKLERIADGYFVNPTISANR